MANSSKILNDNDSHEFHMRVDFYWQSIAVYAVVLIVYNIVRGTFDSYKLTLVINDPLSILLSLFILLSTLTLIIQSYRRIRVIVKKDCLILKSRLGERVYDADSIVKISLGRERKIRFGAIIKVIKIRLKSRRRLIRLRPSSFHNASEFISCVAKLKKNLNK
ncbi:MAG: hypothetical protein NT007_11990 [Candidatus Kapabacteria bacterium]|nr:hypothetical protein [Candidatus Kapabacteria bacterium]